MSEHGSQMAWLGDYEAAVQERLAWAERERLVARLWAFDASLWSDEPAVQATIGQRLGWLTAPLTMAARVAELDCMKAAPYDDVVLMGMGGSSLAPELFQRVFGNAAGQPRLHALDNTTAGAVQGLRERLDLRRTLFVSASKSGTTVETKSFTDFFFEATGGAGSQFVAITDPGSRLIEEAAERGYAALFLNPQDIGGRYSALSFFGLVPATLIGVDVARLLDSARAEIERSTGALPAAQNPGLWLGVLLGTLAASGRDKLTLWASPSLAAFGDWAEQLVAESTGKQGLGLLPIVGERPAAPTRYGADRCFVYLRLEGEDELDGAVAALRAAGHPVVQFNLADRYDLGAHFFRWQFATAVAGVLLGINPFDEPNVTESKQNTNRLLRQWQESGSLPLPTAVLDQDGIAASGDVAADSPADALRAFVDQAGSLGQDFVAIMAYLPMSEANEQALRDLQAAIRDRSGAATTLGFGPRFLHSTGQFHKGGPAQGHFLQIVGDDAATLPIPGVPYDFATLARAQALGDLEALQRRDLPTLRLHLRGESVAEAIAALAAALAS